MRKCSPSRTAALFGQNAWLLFLLACSESAGDDPDSSSGGSGSVQGIISTVAGRKAESSGAGGTTSSGSSAGGTTTNAGGDSNSGGESPACPTLEEEQFSFFLISREATQRESGNANGFGGDLGGITGADAICQRVAEYSSPCQSNKVWHAFLSTSTEDAIDRIGEGPWYDRRGRLFANDLFELINDRPINADPLIIDDFPNEYGTPNHNPDGTGAVDNHEILSGSGTNGRLYRQSASGWGATGCGNREQWSIEKATCWDWTSAEAKGCPRVGHSWPRDMSGNNWISVWNEGGCLPGGNLADTGGPDGTRRVGAAGGYGGWYCFAVTPTR